MHSVPPSPDAIRQLQLMGFPISLIILSLQSCQNDVNKAVNFILQTKSKSPTSSIQPASLQSWYNGHTAASSQNNNNNNNNNNNSNLNANLSFNKQNNMSFDSSPSASSSFSSSSPLFSSASSASVSSSHSPSSSSSSSFPSPSPSLSLSGNRHVGIIKHVPTPNRGFGWIFYHPDRSPLLSLPNDSLPIARSQSHRIWFHARNFNPTLITQTGSSEIPPVGTRVEFDITPGDKGPTGTNIIIVDGGKQGKSLSLSSHEIHNPHDEVFDELMTEEKSIAYPHNVLLGYVKMIGDDKKYGLIEYKTQPKSSFNTGNAPTLLNNYSAAPSPPSSLSLFSSSSSPPPLSSSITEYPEVCTFDLPSIPLPLHSLVTFHPIKRPRVGWQATQVTPIPFSHPDLLSFAMPLSSLQYSLSCNHPYTWETYMIFGDKFLGDESRNLELKSLLYAKSIEYRIAFHGEKYCNAFLNSDGGGWIYFGIEDDGGIYGLKMDRKQKDNIRLSIDRMMTQDTEPAVPTSRYQIEFFNVYNKCIIMDSEKYSNNNNNHNNENYTTYLLPISDRVVVGIFITPPPPSSPLYSIKCRYNEPKGEKRCYQKRDGSVFPMDPSQMKSFMEQKDEEKKKTERDQTVQLILEEIQKKKIQFGNHNDDNNNNDNDMNIDDGHNGFISTDINEMNDNVLNEFASFGYSRGEILDSIYELSKMDGHGEGNGNGNGNRKKKWINPDELFEHLYGKKRKKEREKGKEGKEGENSQREGEREGIIDMTMDDDEGEDRANDQQHHHQNHHDHYNNEREGYPQHSFASSLSSSSSPPSSSSSSSSSSTVSYLSPYAAPLHNSSMEMSSVPSPSSSSSSSLSDKNDSTPFLKSYVETKPKIISKPKSIPMEKKDDSASASVSFLLSEAESDYLQSTKKKHSPSRTQSQSRSQSSPIDIINNNINNNNVSRSVVTHANSNPKSTSAHDFKSHNDNEHWNPQSHSKNVSKNIAKTQNIPSSLPIPLTASASSHHSSPSLPRPFDSSSSPSLLPSPASSSSSFIHPSVLAIARNAKSSSSSSSSVSSSSSSSFPLPSDSNAMSDSSSTDDLLPCEQCNDLISFNEYSHHEKYCRGKNGNRNGNAQGNGKVNGTQRKLSPFH